MIKVTLPILISIFLTISLGTSGQPAGDDPLLPYMLNRSPVFGKDLVIYNKPGFDETATAVCSAFNGWLYACCAYDSLYFSYDSVCYSYMTILRSKDNGITWSTLRNSGYGSERPIKFDLFTVGTTENDLKVIIGYLTENNSGYGFCTRVNRYNGITGELEKKLLYFAEAGSRSRDVSVASDYGFPPQNSNPGSMAAIYTKSGMWPSDSVVIRTSDNGCISFTGRVAFGLPPYTNHKVDIAYGIAPSQNTGRYFVVWETQAHPDSAYGHVYAARTEPFFNSPLSEPVCLDSINPSYINKLANPTIACSYGNADNAESDITEMIVCEYWDSIANQKQLVGFSNLKAATSDNFDSFLIPSSSKEFKQPKIDYNPHDSTFLLTFFNETDKKLPLLSCPLNPSNPPVWNTLSSGYNDQPNLSSPSPYLSVDQLNHTGLFSWMADGPGDLGYALFDSQNSTYTSIHNYDQPADVTSINIFPNPAITSVTIGFVLKNPEPVKIDLFTLCGQHVFTISDAQGKAGLNQLRCDVGNLMPGIYFCTITGNSFTGCEKLIITH